MQGYRSAFGKLTRQVGYPIWHRHTHRKAANLHVKAERKMCGVVPQSWQGGRCAPPLHPPGRGPTSALNLVVPSDRIADPPLAGDFALPAPIDQGSYRRPLKPARGRVAAAPPVREAFLLLRHLHHDFIETLSARSTVCRLDERRFILCYQQHRCHFAGWSVADRHTNFHQSPETVVDVIS